MLFCYLGSQKIKREFNWVGQLPLIEAFCLFKWKEKKLKILISQLYFPSFSAFFGKIVLWEWVCTKRKYAFYMFRMALILICTFQIFIDHLVTKNAKSQEHFGNMWWKPRRNTSFVLFGLFSGDIITKQLKGWSVWFQVMVVIDPLFPVWIHRPVRGL